MERIPKLLYIPMLIFSIVPDNLPLNMRSGIIQGTWVNTQCDTEEKLKYPETAGAD